MRRFVWAPLLLLAFGLSASAQPMTLPVPAKAKVAVVVNGREIPETAVERALKPVAPEARAKARPDVIAFLVDNALVDNYLELLKVAVEPKEVDAQLDTFKKELEAAKQEYAKVLEKMDLTEAELKAEILNQLRWEKFVAQQATEEKLKQMFDSAPEIFDGTTVRARHILVPPATADEAGKAAALKKVTEVRAGLEQAIASAAGKLPADADNLTKQKALNRAIEDAFGAAAKEHSTCPSKRDGGDLGEFPRMGSMVEPFAKAAFALKPYQLSEPVLTQYGYHLILVTNRKPGEAVKFEAVKGAVTEVYAARIRDLIIQKMKADPNTKIEIK